MRSLIIAAGLAASLAAVPALAQAPAGPPINIRGKIVLAALAALPAFAQAPQGTPTQIRGKIVKVSGQT